MSEPVILPPETAIRQLLNRLRRPATLLVAVSGGSDSTGLLVALAALRGNDCAVRAVTVDHGLRPESADEAMAVGRLCGTLGIAHEIRRWEGRKPETGISAAAREARYRLLCDAADACGATAILSGHTFDDQMETVAMRAERSADVDAPGLAGMAEAVLLHRRHWLLRPLLHSRRAAIRAFLTRQGHGWIDDPSNMDQHYERVRARARLAAVGAAKEGVPVADIEAAAEKRRLLADRIAGWLAEHAHVRRGVLMQVSPEGMRADAQLLRPALSICAAVLGGRVRGPAGDSMQRVVDALAGGQRTRIAAGRVVFDRRPDGLYLCREHRSLPVLRVLPGETQVWDGRFRIVNGAGQPVEVGPAEVERQAAPGLFPGVPPAIALRAARVVPDLRGPQAATGLVKIEPVLAPYDRFLPQFDLVLARRLALMFRCDDFPSLPFENCGRKS